MKMDCNWTEKISLLIDGELSAEEARVAEQHAAGCHACQLAREDFMLMRRQINSLRAEPNLMAQREALRNILGVASPKPSGGWRERAATVFALPRFSPALAGVAALVLVAVLAAVVMMRRPARVEVATNSNHNAPSSTNAVVTPAPVAPTEEARASGASNAAPDKVEKAANKNEEGRGQRRGVSEVRVETASVGKSRRAPLLSASKLREEEAAARRAKIIERLRLPLTPKVAVDNAEFAETELASASSKLVPADAGTARHVEQAQQLLRSFRNARAGGEPSTSDIAYEKRRSRELLYRNIVLRREAASKGNVTVASLLDNLEPILIDIANLPDRPAQDEVRSITDRMKKKNIVAMLQVANASRMY